jgi:multidrug efflux system outer membrane protein
MLRSKAPVLFVLLLAAQGCTVGPRYKPPVVPVPDNWRMPVSESSSLGNEKWWELLKDPVLQQMIRTALAHNTNIRTAAAQIMQAQAEVMVVRSAQLPQISAGPDFTSERVPGSTVANTSTKSQTVHLYSLTGGVSYNSDFWGEYRQATAEATRICWLLNKRAAMLS